MKTFGDVYPNNVHMLKVRNVKSDEIKTYEIISSRREIELYKLWNLEIKISEDTPLVKAFIGAEIGHIVHVSVSAGVSEYEILEIKDMCETRENFTRANCFL